MQLRFYRAINLKHRGAPVAAAVAAARGVADAAVRTGDRFDLRRRLDKARASFSDEEEKTFHAAVSEGGDDDDDADVDIRIGDDDGNGDVNGNGDGDGDSDDSTVPIEQTFTRGNPLNCTVGEKSRFVSGDDGIGSVEQLVLDVYALPHAGAWKGMHGKNSRI
jgi:hypothetical protein